MSCTAGRPIRDSKLSGGDEPQQLFIFALIMATYMPCLSAFAIMRKEFGWKDTLKVTLASISLAFLLGGLVNLVLTTLGY